MDTLNILLISLIDKLVVNLSRTRLLHIIWRCRYTQEKGISGQRYARFLTTLPHHRNRGVNKQVSEVFEDMIMTINMHTWHCDDLHFLSVTQPRSGFPELALLEIVYIYLKFCGQVKSENIIFVNEKERNHSVDKKGKKSKR